MEDREKIPDEFPKVFFGPYSLGVEREGFTLYDAIPEQMTNLALHYMPEGKLKFAPILDSKKALELY
jgi:hypothetical protein